MTATIDRIPGSSNQGEDRMKQMLSMRAEKFFVELEELFWKLEKRWDSRAEIEHEGISSLCPNFDNAPL
jgi:hypothetical protein